MTQPIFYIENKPLCNTLNRVIFTGCTKYFHHLEKFFLKFGSTIKYLTINIELIYSIIDGKRFENEVLNKMPCLLSLNLIIHSIAICSDPINIETFQNLSWQKFNPIVSCNDIHSHQHTIFTLPYSSNQVRNHFISSEYF